MVVKSSSSFDGRQTLSVSYASDHHHLGMVDDDLYIYEDLDDEGNLLEISRETSNNPKPKRT